MLLKRRLAKGNREAIFADDIRFENMLYGKV